MDSRGFFCHAFSGYLHLCSYNSLEISNNVLLWFLPHRINPSS